MTPDELKRSPETIAAKTEECDPAEKVGEIFQFIEKNNLEAYFGCDKESLKTAVRIATEKILQKAGSNEGKKQALELINESLSRTGKYAERKGEYYVHGTGSVCLNAILEDGKIVPGGKGLGGADDKHGQKNSEISLAENDMSGFGISYVYAKNFINPDNRKNILAIDADMINATGENERSSLVLEAWDEISDTEKEKYSANNRKLGASDFTREFLTKVDNIQIYTDYYKTREMIGVYKLLLDRFENLSDNQEGFPKYDSSAAPKQYIDGEIGKHLPYILVDSILHYIDNERKVLWKKDVDVNLDSEIKETEKDEHPWYVRKYKDYIKGLEKKCDDFRQGKNEEDERFKKRVRDQLNQYPVIFYVNKSGIPKEKVLHKRPADFWQFPGEHWHPSEKEVRARGEIGLSSIEAIQVSANKINEVRRSLDELAGVAGVGRQEDLLRLKENIIPLETFEVERVIRKELRSEKTD